MENSQCLMYNNFSIASKWYTSLCPVVISYGALFPGIFLKGGSHKQDICSKKTAILPLSTC